MLTDCLYVRVQSLQGNVKERIVRSGDGGCESIGTTKVWRGRRSAGFEVSRALAEAAEVQKVESKWMNVVLLHGWMIVGSS